MKNRYIKTTTFSAFILFPYLPFMNREILKLWIPLRFASSARVTVKPLHSRKTFLMDYYKHIMENNSLVLFAHHNNLLKQETAYFRYEIQQLGGHFTLVRNNLFKVYLRNSHRDPCAPVPRNEQNWNHPLLPLFKGPTAAITFPETDPSKVTKLLKILGKSQNELLIIGARIENKVCDLAELNKFKSLPSKPELQSQLTGLLHILSGAGLVKTLETNSQILYLTLKSHEENINSNEN